MSASCSCARRLNSMGSDIYRAVAGPFAQANDFAIYDLGGLGEDLKNQLTEVVCTMCGAKFYIGQMEALQTYGQEKP